MGGLSNFGMAKEGGEREGEEGRERERERKVKGLHLFRLTFKIRMYLHVTILH